MSCRRCRQCARLKLILVVDDSSSTGLNAALSTALNAANRSRFFILKTISLLLTIR